MEQLFGKYQLNWTITFENTTSWTQMQIRFWRSFSSHATPTLFLYLPSLLLIGVPALLVTKPVKSRQNLICVHVVLWDSSSKSPKLRNKTQVPINQIYNSTFDFEESISIIKTKGCRLQSRENCEKGTEYRNRLEVKLIIFYYRFFPGTFPRFLTLLLRCYYNTYDY